ncbi:hypothetical protein FNV43_RR25200 [Rhamnella rubrinervis]|uniref:PGG domain-containing protein n=1 Tax=Rhamnella rubrinervis TaxID=2594499 RepID=A0A8K0GLY5_9ROSA|nr:hypothetical protein FNV43_RR25200 [Rhamnella rubrinervis]
MDPIIIRCDEEDTMRRLYEASMEGSVDTLNSLIEKDPLILSKISLGPFGETPLHVSASFGHVNFTMKLLSIKPQGPKLAVEVDRLKRSPLLLASAEGHTDIVQALIQVNDTMCLATDQDGRIPLHYAAMRGRVEVIKLLIGSQRESIWKKLIGGETVLHLCVLYNQLEALKVLVESADYENNEFLNSEDQNGNTILHLAVMLKQVETTKYLLSLPEVITGAHTSNQSGLKAFDLVEHLPKDLKSLEIQNAFQDAGFHREKQQYNHLQRPAASSSKAATTSMWRKFGRFLQKYDGDWIKDKTGALMIVATMIATMTFQTAVNPPGGVWQESRNNTIDCTPQNDCIAGTAVLAHIWEYDYLRFLVFDSMAFISLVVVIFLLISGFPVRYTPCMWLLNLFTFSALTFSALTFREGMYLVSPSTIHGVAYLIYIILYYIWVFLLGVMILVQTIRILILVVRKLLKTFGYKWMTQLCSGNHSCNSTAHV